MLSNSNHAKQVTILNPLDAYRKQKDPREEVLMRYAPLVKRVALYHIARFPKCVQLDDLIQAGMIGLLEASQTYDANNEKGASFETFAYRRISGAMIDEVRRYDWAPRAVNQNSRAVSEAMSKLAAKLGRQPTDTEVAGKLGVSLDEYNRMLLDGANSKLIGIEDLGESADDFLHDDNKDTGIFASPEKQMLKARFTTELATALKKLPPREALVVSLYYNEGMNFREVGEILDLSEARAYQIMSQALARIRSMLKEWLSGEDGIDADVVR